ncbi:WD repeat-containing protein 24 [Gaertneriomyces sp. JEL0708]|nr:WD repeat-containing protein 24 [Gaertneriomyces sp. JEL0708]
MAKRFLEAATALPIGAGFVYHDRSVPPASTTTATASTPISSPSVAGASASQPATIDNAPTSFNAVVRTATGSNTSASTASTTSSSVGVVPSRHAVTAIPPAPPLPATTRLQTLRYRTNGPLSALSASPDHDMVAVAGREVLKILAVHPTEVTEVLNLRGGVKLNLNFSINDVKWAPAFAKSTIATAATSGTVIIWDLSRPSPQKLSRHLSEHTRSINRITFHPIDPVLLLSASQDGTLRLWDLRAKSIARNAFEGKAESVRDVQFSPVNQYEFCAAFENGTLQRWDIRFPASWERKWSAHNGLALTVDYAEGGKFIASGGRDRQIKVWDLNSSARKPVHAIYTPYPISRVQFRPSYHASTSSGGALTQQLSYCALATDYRIHTYDLNRSYVPEITLEGHENVTTGFLWMKGRDPGSAEVWSCGKDRVFLRQSIDNGYFPGKSLGKACGGWNVFGDLALAVPKQKTSHDLHRRSWRDDSSSAGAGFPVETTANEKSKFSTLQMTVLADTDTFDYQGFQDLAKDYMLAISNTDDVATTDTTKIFNACMHNAEKALNCGKMKESYTWKVLGLLFGVEPPPERNLSRLFGPDSAGASLDDKARMQGDCTLVDQKDDVQADVVARLDVPHRRTVDTPPPSSPHSDSYLLESHHNKSGSAHQRLRTWNHIRKSPQMSHNMDPDKDWSDTDSSESDIHNLTTLGRTTKPSLPSLKIPYGQLKKTEQPDLIVPNWDFADIVGEMLEYYGERGDVQMCVTVLGVLDAKVGIREWQSAAQEQPVKGGKDRIQKRLWVDRQRYEEWCLSYIGSVLLSQIFSIA